MAATSTGAEIEAFITTAAFSLLEMVKTEAKDPELLVTPAMEAPPFEKVPLYPFEVAAHAECTQTWSFTGTPV